MTTLPVLTRDRIAIPAAEGVTVSVRYTPVDVCPLHGARFDSEACPVCGGEQPERWLRATVATSQWEECLDGLAWAAERACLTERMMLAVDPAARAGLVVELVASIHESGGDLSAIRHQAWDADPLVPGLHADRDGALAWVDPTGIVVPGGDIPTERLDPQVVATMLRES